MTTRQKLYGHRKLFAIILGTIFILSLMIIPDPYNLKTAASNTEKSETIISSFVVQPEVENSIGLNAIAEDGVINVGEYDQLVSIPDAGSEANLDFYYTIDEVGGKIHMGITAPGLGYVSIGWGAANKMADADIIWGGYNSVTYYEDTFGNKATDHIVDTIPNIDSCFGSEDATTTVLECTRSLDTGDTAEDVVITKDTQTTLIMAYDLTSDLFATTHDAAGDILHTWIAGVTATVPDAPTGLSTTPGNAQVSLSWTAPASDGGSTITDYNIYRSTTQGSYAAPLGSVGSATTSYIDSTASNGQLYYYVVKAVNSVGEGAQSNEASATPSTTPGTPTTLTATKGNTFVDLSWVAPTDTGGSALTDYKIYENGSPIATISAVTTIYNDTGLINGNTYSYTVSAINVNGEGSQTAAEIAIPSTTPGTPTGLTATKGNTFVDLIWNAPADTGGSGLSDYKIYRDGIPIATISSVTTIYNDTGLINGNTYSYTVSAINANGEGSESASDNATPSTTPGIPTGLTATKGNTFVDLSWNAPGDNGGSVLTNYKIYRDGTPIATISSATTTYNDTGLTNGDTYSYTVSAINANGEGSESASDNATPSTIPGVPTGLTANKGNTFVDLSWNAPGDNGGSALTNYKIYRDGTPIATISSATTTYNDTGLTNGNTYSYTVSAINANGEGSESTSDNATPSTTPGTPTGLTATKGNTFVDLSWNAPGDNGGSVLTNYKIYRDGSPIATISSTTTTYNDTGLTNGDTYTYTVSAINANGEGSESASDNATPSTTPGTPTGLIATKGDTVVDLSWIAPADNGGSVVTDYKIYRDGGLIITVSAAVTNHQDTGRTNGQSYTYTVSAVNANGEGSQSLSESATPSTTPGKPTGFSAIAGNSSVLLSWTAPVDNGGSPITGYNIYRNTTSGSYSSALVTVGAGVSTYNDTTATNGITYYYIVTTINVNGESVPATEVSAKPVTIPSKPLDLVATYGSNEVNLTWSNPLDDGGVTITQFRVYRSTTSGSYAAPIATLSATTFTYFDSSVSNGNTYFYVVTAVTGEGESPNSDEISIIPRTIPDPPTTLIGTHGDTIVDLTWTAPGDNGGSVLINYTIYRDGSFLANVTAGTTTHQDTGLTNGVSYSYVVRAVNSEGDSIDSNTELATPATIPDKPTSFSASSGDDEVVLNWVAPSDNGGATITSYNIYRSTVSSSYGAVLISVGTLTYTDSSVSNGVTYYYIITAINAEGESVAATEVSVTPVGPPSVPLNLDGVIISTNVTLIWDVPSNNGGSVIGNYSVYRSNDLGGPYTWISNTTLLTYNDTGLANGQIYYYVVTASNSYGEGQYSAELRMTIADVPSAPLNPSAIYGDQQISLSWEIPSYTGSTALQNYSMYRSINQGGPYIWISNVTAGTTTYLDAGLTNGVVYYYVISVTNLEGEGPNSIEVNATPKTVPDAPADLTATYGDTLVDLTWTAPLDNGGSVLINYTIYRDSVFLINVTAGTTNYQDTGLTNGDSYSYIVRAVNSEGDSIDSNSASSTPKTVPTQPQNFIGVPSKSQVDLSWTAPSSDGGSILINYTIYRDSVFLINVSAGVLIYSDTTVINGITYYYTITAVNSAGESILSTEISVIPGQVPNAPQNLESTYSDQSVDLNWDAPTDDGGLTIFQYHIFRATSIGGPYTDIGQSPTTSYSDAGLTNGQIYYYYVTAENTKGQGGDSTIISVIPAIAPSPPTNLGGNTGDKSVTLSWDAPSSDGGSALINYTIYRDSVFLTNVTAGTTIYQDTGLTNGNSYSYTVRAVNLEGESIDSNSVILTPVSTPGIPQNLVSGYGDSYVTLTWIAPTDDGGSAIIAYTVYRDGFYLFNQTVGTSYTDNTVTNGASYTYTVTAWNSEGESLESTATNITPKTLPGVPTGLSAGYGDSYVTLTWTAPADDGGSAIIVYTIYRDGSYLFNQTVGTSYTDSTATNGILYIYTVTAWNSEGESLESTLTNVTPKTLPSVPTGLSAGYGNSFVTLTWNAPTDDGGATIIVYTIYKDGVYLFNQTVGTSYTDNAVTNGVSYSYAVTAWNSEGESLESTATNAIPKTIPGAPTDLSASYGDSYVALTWTAPTDDGGATITGYNIYRDGIYQTTQTVGTSFTDLTAVNGISYSYKIMAINSEGESLESNTINVTPSIIASAPQNLTLTHGDGFVDLNWDVPVDDGGSVIIEYRIYREGILIATVSVGTSYSDTGLNNGMLYNYYVTAVNSEGEGTSSLVVSETPRTIPSVPTDLSATYGNSFVTLTWISPIVDGGSTIIDYTIYRDGIYLTTQSVGLSYTDNAVSNGVSYSYSITAVNSEGESLQSSTISVTPAALPTVPISFSVELYDSNNAYLKWDTPIDDGGYTISQYRIYRSLDGTEFASFANVSALEYNDTYLFLGSKYTYKVAAVNFEGMGAFTEEINVTPKTLPTEPVIEIVESGDSFVSISWNDPMNGGSTIFEYKVYRSTSPLGLYTDPIALLPLTHHFYKDKAVDNGLIYYYVVTGTNEIGESDFSNEVSATPTSVPDAPINLVGTEESETAILSWEAGFDGGSPIIEYHVYRNSTNNETLSLISTTSEFTETDSDLVKGTTYEYIVCALNINGESLGSNKVSITIPPDTSSTTSTSSTSSEDGTGSNNGIQNIAIAMIGMIAIFGLGTLYAKRRR
ncbi:MAG: hypothetical protein GPJ54_12790 [Candidatus Heimdallarchaeota archaeon]|nr:hypothetical protein [Candidatus Heimdallarchaeota archaeon]